MEINFDWIIFVHLAAAVLGVLSAAVIFRFAVKNNPAYQPLAIGQLSISLAVFVGFSNVSQLTIYWPFMYRMGNLFALIFIPMPYLHMVFFTKQRLWRWYDSFHLIPLLVYLVDFWHVFSMSSAQKAELIVREVQDLNLLGMFAQSKYFGPGFHQEFRTILFSLYWIATVWLFWKWNKSRSESNSDAKGWRNWMVIFLGCQVFLWFPFYLSMLGLEIMTTYHIVNSFSVVWLMVSSLSLFFFPSLLYGGLLQKSAQTHRQGRVHVKQESNPEEEKKLEEFIQIIESEMDGKKFFLERGYSINDFSNDIHIPVYQISKSLNTFRSISFIDFINLKRIHHCVENIQNGKWSNYTIEAIANECGFNNRNSFTNAFKKFIGTSPSEYRENIKH
ncbi:helix-turn-helix domain-containing protein [Mariniradius sediminis]|uniref:AraC family transcriptional regulator n=1 Tax=Mariniradius sediminis TaxID=2909237 RepID=A0ABS9BZ02_9BACT|nr:AraC family transcriptional regulator [Mariniradius sediminis]MCF1752895.1 AraC family transcriptional regulator [Mariniradius sediminis]